MNVADYLLECADPRISALVSESHSGNQETHNEEGSAWRT